MDSLLDGKRRINPYMQWGRCCSLERGWSRHDKRLLLAQFESGPFCWRIDHPVLHPIEPWRPRFQDFNEHDLRSQLLCPFFEYLFLISSKNPIAVNQDSLTFKESLWKK